MDNKTGHLNRKLGNQTQIGHAISTLPHRYDTMSTVKTHQHSASGLKQLGKTINLPVNIYNIYRNKIVGTLIDFAHDL